RLGPLLVGRDSCAFQAGGRSCLVKAECFGNRTCDYRCPFLAQLDCAWNCGDEPAADWRVPRSFGAGNKKVLCWWETQQVRLCGFIFFPQHVCGTVHPFILLVGIYGALSLRPKQMRSEYFTISSPPSIPRKSADLLHLQTCCATNYP
ncbi:unnamed protein product, partial [Ectocarpus sp. 12 AP-2014]